MNVTVSIPATIANLGPGFDIFGLALQLQNEIHATPADGGLTVDPGHGDGATDDPEFHDPAHNLVARAYTLACQRLGASPDGVHLRCVNAIPFSRGLGSSAAATLGGILIASALHAAPWDEFAILRLAAEVEGHGDNVAAALLGGMTITAPAGPTVSVAVPDRLRCVLFIPDQRLPTSAARQVVPATFTREQAVYNAARCALLVQALATGELALLGAAMEDHWHQPARAALFPAFPALITAARQAGAAGACLCGAGPSVLALVDGTTTEVEAALTAAAQVEGVPGRVVVHGIRNWGARVDVSA